MCHFFYQLHFYVACRVFYHITIIYLYVAYCVKFNSIYR